MKKSHQLCAGALAVALLQTLAVPSYSATPPDGSSSVTATISRDSCPTSGDCSALDALLAKSDLDPELLKAEKELKAAPDDINKVTAYGTIVKQSMKKMQAAGQRSEAINLGERGLKLLSSDVGLLHQLGTCYLDRFCYAQNRQDYERAKALWNQERVARPSTPDAALLEGLKAYENGDYPSALKCFQRAHNMRNNDPYTLSFAGMTLARLGNHKQAAQGLGMAVAGMKNNPALMASIATEAQLSGNAEMAAKYFGEANRCKNPQLKLITLSELFPTKASQASPATATSTTAAPATATPIQTTPVGAPLSNNQAAPSGMTRIAQSTPPGASLSNNQAAPSGMTRIAQSTPPGASLTNNQAAPSGMTRIAQSTPPGASLTGSGQTPTYGAANMGQANPYGAMAGMGQANPYGAMAGMGQANPYGAMAGMSQANPYGAMAGMGQANPYGAMAGMGQTNPYGAMAGMGQTNPYGAMAGMGQTNPYGNIAGGSQPSPYGNLTRIQQFTPAGASLTNNSQMAGGMAGGSQPSPYGNLTRIQQSTPAGTSLSNNNQVAATNVPPSAAPSATAGTVVSGKTAPAAGVALAPGALNSNPYRGLLPFPGLTPPVLTEVTTVELETDAGKITIEVYPQAAPHAAERFIELVKSGYYDNTPIFRVVNKPKPFVAQFGINWRPEHKTWQHKYFKDDPSLFQLQPGTLAFAKAGKDINSTQIFINYGDNNFLRQIGGFTTFARITKGLDIASKFRAVGDPSMGLDQNSLWENGENYLNSLSDKPNMILKATIAEPEDKEKDKEKKDKG